jgi:hypothetical protein
MCKTNSLFTTMGFLAFGFVCVAQTTSPSGAPGGRLFNDYSQWNAAWKNWSHCIWNSPGMGKECGPGPVLAKKRPQTTSGERRPAEAQRFSRPNITGVQLDQASIDELKHESEILQGKGLVKGLLAWSPLILLAGESNAVHAAFSISQTDWEGLARTTSAIDKITFHSLENQARDFAEFSSSTSRNPQLKKFWTAMADFYASQVPEH